MRIEERERERERKMYTKLDIALDVKVLDILAVDIKNVGQEGIKLI